MSDQAVKKIGLVRFYGANLLSLELLTSRIKGRFGEQAKVEYVMDDPQKAKEADYLLVSLYWWEDVFEYIKWLAETGINPARKRPVIIMGGMSFNPWLLNGYYNYGVVGDGEDIICDLIDGIEIDGVGRDYKSDYVLKVARLVPFMAIEDRSVKIARIEISRGCKYRCQFCQLTYQKPYQEIPKEVILTLARKAPTNRVAMFSPDRGSHTDFDELMDAIGAMGKQDMASDIRLDKIVGRKTASRVRFGLEALSERIRKQFLKVPTNEMLVDGLEYVAKVLKTPNGKPTTNATMYLVSDLPGERREDAQEFWETLKILDERLTEKFTLFTSISTFCPSPFTPMRSFGVNLQPKWNDWFEEFRPFLKNVVIAKRGGVDNPVVRLKKMICARGDERLTKLLFWLSATKEGQRVSNLRTIEAAQAIITLAAKLGVSEQELYGPMKQISFDRIKRKDNPDWIHWHKDLEFNCDNPTRKVQEPEAMAV